VAHWTAIVLTGGSSTRLGQDKATARLAGRRLIDRVLDQIPPDVDVVVVGPDPEVQRPVRVTREQPPGGGPVAAIGAALPLVGTEVVGVVAADMPWAVPVVARLAEDIGPEEARVPEAGGHLQGLAAAYRVAALRRLDLAAGTSMRALLSRLRVTHVQMAEELFADIDTPAALADAQRRLAIMDPDTERCDMQSWLDAVKKDLGLDAEVDVELILDVAKDAAHNVQRPAAPVTTYLLGLAVGAGASPAEAAAKITALAQAWDRPGE
jgi:molybdopterin-guanine dinucleotide biosynthesis protein A